MLSSFLKQQTSVTSLSTNGADCVDPFTQMSPLHFACAPICPTSPQSAGGRITSNSQVPCTGATATALSSALSIYRRQHRLEAASAGSTASRRISSRSFTRAGTRTQQLPSSQQSLTVRLPEPENSKQQQTAIYSRAFRIPTKEEEQQQQDEGVISPRIATAVLTFNAALCAHLHSVATGDSTIAPHRALCLYSTAYSIVLMEQQKQQTLDWLLLTTTRTSHSSSGLWQQSRRISFLRANDDESAGCLAAGCALSQHGGHSRRLLLEFRPSAMAPMPARCGDPLDGLFANGNGRL